MLTGSAVKRRPSLYFFTFSALLAMTPGKADHLPGRLVLVAAVDRIGEHALHHVLVEHVEEDAARQPALQA